MPKIFEPLQLGAIQAQNRVFMAPLTRGRATVDGVPTSVMVEYYAQRANAGLIISEATGISREGLGWPNAPGIWNKEQVEKWKRITQAVHSKGGRIVAQLWHMGRAGHSSVMGVQPVSSSPLPYPYDIHTNDGKQKPEIPREATHDDIKRIVKDYHNAAKNAIDAGFDGVQIHGANGYLVDQFLRDSANTRTDKYGGSIENRTRFLEEVVTTVVDAVGGERTALRLSPNGDTQGCHDSNAKALFKHVSEVLNKFNLAFLELREIGENDTFGKSDEPKIHSTFRQYYKGIIGLNQEYTREAAIEAVEDGTADFIAFGRKFIANPDLVEKLKNNERLTKDNVATWYSKGPEGYIDYPATYKL